MSHETLRLTRNILLRSFVVGIVIGIVLGLVTMIGWTSWVGLAGRWFHIDAATLTPSVLKFFMNIRFFLLFILLTPALAIHWTIKKDSGEKAKTNN
jgi:Mg/Co/Ni transporter MgtE